MKLNSLSKEFSIGEIDIFGRRTILEIRRQHKYKIFLQFNDNRVEFFIQWTFKLCSLFENSMRDCPKIPWWVASCCGFLLLVSDRWDSCTLFSTVWPKVDEFIRWSLVGKPRSISLVEKVTSLTPPFFYLYERIKRFVYSNNITERHLIWSNSYIKFHLKIPSPTWKYFNWSVYIYNRVHKGIEKLSPSPKRLKTRPSIRLSTETLR